MFVLSVSEALAALASIILDVSGNGEPSPTDEENP
jgi:hypothetical protein